MRRPRLQVGVKGGAELALLPHHKVDTRARRDRPLQHARPEGGEVLGCRGRGRRAGQADLADAIKIDLPELLIPNT